MPEKHNDRILAIDGLRFLYALIIMLYHVAPGFGYPWERFLKIIYQIGGHR